MSNADRRPKWWSNTHDSGWERTKEALKRDWEQTKADLTGGGQDLNQDASETFRQAAGKEPIPPRGVPNPPDAGDLKAQERKAERQTRRWEDSQDAVAYGWGARQNGDRDWKTSENELRNEWSGLGHTRTWDDARDDVRHGWERGTRSKI